MKQFVVILVSTFLSFLGAQAVWDTYKESVAQQEAAKMVATAKALAEQEADAGNVIQAAVDEVMNEYKYSWKTETRKNPVTGEVVATANRFSEDTKAALTFRCYGVRRFNILVSFPDDIDWISSSGRRFASMKFRVDKGELEEFIVDRSSSSTAAITKDRLELSQVSTYTTRAEADERNKPRLAFKTVGNAKLFEASISDGTIYDQTISIDVSGIGEAIAPVLELCGKAEI